MTLIPFSEKSLTADQVLRLFRKTSKANYLRIARQYLYFCLEQELSCTLASRDAYLGELLSRGKKSLHAYKTPVNAFLKFLSASQISEIRKDEQLTVPETDTSLLGQMQSFVRLQKSKASQETYRAQLLRFHAFLQKQEWSVSKKSVQLYLNSLLKSEASPFSVNLALSAIKSFSRYLSEQLDLHPSAQFEDKQQLHYLLAQVLSVRAEKIPQDQFYKNGLSLEEVKAVIDVLPSEHKAIVALMAYAGLRVCEVYRLRGENVLSVHGRIEVLRKGRKRKVLPIFDILLPYLQKLKAAPGERLFALGETEKKGTAKIRAVVNAALVKTGLKFSKPKKVSAHSFRHAFAQNLLEKGRGIEEVKELLGHSSINTTMIYVRQGVQERLINDAGLRGVF